jgi:NAD(P)H-hydrate repair Nnr-like enzyme with NAD(P)H-hydrate epimerase domain
MAELSKIPFLTTQQMIEVDRLMVDVYGIQLVQMMENAGRHLAALAVERFLEGNPVRKNTIRPTQTFLTIAANGNVSSHNRIQQ